MCQTDVLGTAVQSVGLITQSQKKEQNLVYLLHCKKLVVKCSATILTTFKYAR